MLVIDSVLGKVEGAFVSRRAPRSLVASGCPLSSLNISDETLKRVPSPRQQRIVSLLAN